MAVESAVEGVDLALGGEGGLLGEQDPGRELTFADEGSAQACRAPAVEEGWICLTVQVGRPVELRWPCLLIAIEIFWSWGGLAPSVVVICPPTETRTGAEPVRGRAWGARLPVKTRRRSPRWAISAWAERTPKVRQRKARAPHRALNPGRRQMIERRISALHPWSGNGRRA